MRHSPSRDFLLVAGPPDARGPGESAAWVSIGKTPPSKYFELLHRRDHFAPVILPNVSAFDLEKFGDPVAPELSEPPNSGTHILVTDLEPRGGYATPNPHTSTSVDQWTPLAPDGTPLLRDAWRYMLGDRRDWEDNDDRNRS